MDNIIARVFAIAEGKTTDVADRLDPQREQARARTIEDDIRDQEARAAENGYILDRPCINCGHPITEQRLEALPETDLCIDCATSEEVARHREELIEANERRVNGHKPYGPKFGDTDSAIAQLEADFSDDRDPEEELQRREDVEYHMRKRIEQLATAVNARRL